VGKCSSIPKQSSVLTGLLDLVELDFKLQELHISRPQRGILSTPIDKNAAAENIMVTEICLESS
jgi:hypothetical protein